MIWIGYAPPYGVPGMLRNLTAHAHWEVSDAVILGWYPA